MAQIKDSFGTEYYTTEFELNYDLEKPGNLACTAIIPSGDVTDSFFVSTACGTTMLQTYNMCQFGSDLYVCTGSSGGDLSGQIYRYVNEQYWEVVYNGEGLREVPYSLILTNSGTYIYWGAAYSGKVFLTNTGSSYTQVGNLGGGTRVKKITSYSYGGTNYVVAIVGKKIWRSVEGSSTWTDVTHTIFNNNDITSSAYFNGRLWFTCTRAGMAYYTTDNCSTFNTVWFDYTYSVYGTNTPSLIVAFGSYLYIATICYRIFRISTTDTVEWVWGYQNAQDGNEGLSSASFESKLHIGFGDGSIVYTTDGTGNAGSWAILVSLPSLGYGIPLSMGVQTNLIVGTNNYQALQYTATSHIWSVVKTISDKNIFCMYQSYTAYYGTGGDVNNTGHIFVTMSGPSGAWTPYYGIPEYNVTDLAVFGSYLYACTAGKGFILRSSDGRDWNVVYDSASTNLYTLGLTSGYIWAGGDASNYVYRSTDGVSWSAVTGATVTAYCMTKNSSTTTLHIGCSDGTIKQVTNAGAWTTVLSGIGAAVRCIFAAPSTSNVQVVAGTANGRFYYTTTNGATWGYYTPESASRIIYGVTFYNGKFYVVQDNAKVYNSTSPWLGFTFVYEFTISDSQGRCIFPYGINLYIGGYAADSRACIYKYANSMLTKEIYHGVEGLGTFDCLYIWNNYIYAGGWLSTNNAIIIRSSDGVRWEEVYRSSVANSAVKSLYAHGSYLYAGISGTASAQVYRAYTGKDWSLAWSTTEDNIEDLYSWGGYLYAATSRASNYGRVYRSSDGITWGEVWNTADATKTTVFKLHAWGSYLYAGGGGTSSTKRFLIRSSSGGSGTWADVSSGLTSTYTGVTAIQSFGSYIYVGCYYDEAFRPVWRSSSGAGGTWSQVTGLNSIFPVTSCYDLTASSTKIYALVNYSEIFESTDGVTWSRIQSMSTNSSIYNVRVFFDKVITAGQRMYYQPISRMGRLIQKIKNAEYFDFYSCGNGLTEKYILKEIEILNESLMNMKFQSHVIDLWRSFGYYIEGTNGYVDYSTNGIYADELANKIVDSMCNSKFRIKYCPHVRIKIKGEWLSRTQWMYEIARNLSFAINNNSSYPTCQLMASSSQSDTIIDKMNVVIENNGDIYIMPAGSSISGTNPNYVGYFAKRSTDITGYTWEATRVSANVIDYVNAIVLDGSGTGPARKNYLATPISVSYSNSLDTDAKVKELSNIVYSPPYSGAAYCTVGLYGSSMSVWAQITNPNFKVDCEASIYHPSLVVTSDENVIIKAAVSNTTYLDALANIYFLKEAGFSFGGGNDSGNPLKMYRAVLQEQRTTSGYTYYVKLFLGTNEVASTTLTAGSDIDTVSNMNYLVVKWYKSSGVPTIKVYMSKTSMPDPSVATPKITYSSSADPYDFGIVGLYGRCGYRVTGSGVSYAGNTPTVKCFFNTFSVTGKSLSLWGSNSITKPVMLIRDKSVTSKDEARNIAMAVYQNSSSTKELIIRVDPSRHMWGSTANRILIGQWVTISGKGYYDGEYRVKTIKVTQDGMFLGLDNSKVNFSDYVDSIRQQVNRIDAFG